MSTLAKTITVTLSSLFLLLASVYGVFELTDGRYFLRAEAQSLQRTIEQQRVDALYRERTDLKREEARRGKRGLTSFERERLETVEREIRAWEQRKR